MSQDNVNTGSTQGADAIDRLIHEPARFLIMANLYVVESADFLFIMRQTGLTRGNLSSHMSKLEDAGYVRVEKKFVKKIPRTVYHLTPDGRAAFSQYRDQILELLRRTIKKQQ